MDKSPTMYEEEVPQSSTMARASESSPIPTTSTTTEEATDEGNQEQFHTSYDYSMEFLASFHESSQFYSTPENRDQWYEDSAPIRQYWLDNFGYYLDVITGSYIYADTEQYLEGGEEGLDYEGEQEDDYFDAENYDGDEGVPDDEEYKDVEYYDDESESGGYCVPERYVEVRNGVTVIFDYFDASPKSEFGLPSSRKQRKNAKKRSKLKSKLAPEEPDYDVDAFIEERLRNKRKLRGELEEDVQIDIFNMSNKGIEEMRQLFGAGTTTVLNLEQETEKNFKEMWAKNRAELWPVIPLNP